MSIYRLKNMTGADVQLDWLGQTIHPNIPFDLLTSIRVDQIHGVMGGEYYDNIAQLIRTGNWRIHDGDRDLLNAEALHFLKTGDILPLDDLLKKYGKYCAFESHNMADINKWPGGDSKFVITPNAGYMLFLLNSKTYVADDCVLSPSFLMQITAGGAVAQQWEYTTIAQLLTGPDDTTRFVQVGSPNLQGAPNAYQINYIYKKPLEIRSDYAMTLTFKVKDNIPPVPTSLLKVRVEAIAMMI